MFKSLVMALGQGVGAWLSGSRLTGYLTQTSSTSIGQGQYLGTDTGDDAAPGNIGEYISSTVLVGSAVSLTSAVTANITSISLTAGDWDVEGMVQFAGDAAAVINLYTVFTSTTSATFPTIPNNGAYASVQYAAAAVGPGRNTGLPIGRMRLSLSVATTVYLEADAFYTGGTMLAYGFIGARRVR